MDSLSHINGKEAIIFDMDGVLLLSSAVHECAYQDALCGTGISALPYSRLAGMRTDQAMRLLLSSNNVSFDDELIEQLTRRKRELAWRRMTEATPIAARTLEVLSDLRLRHRLALATSASRASAELFLEASGTRHLFEVVLTGEDVVQAKPDPDIYLQSLHSLGVSRSNGIVIEDSINGIRAAHAAGLPVLGMTGTLSRKALAKQGVAAAIDCLFDLLPGNRRIHFGNPSQSELQLPTETMDDVTVIVPAAGRGSRLGHTAPKILYPVLDRPLIDWLIDLLEPLAQRFVFVVSPDGEEQVRKHLIAASSCEFDTVVQPVPRGMGDAVHITRDVVHSPVSLVVWGDQILLSPNTVTSCLQIHHQYSAALTMPTIVKSQPYIHLVRDPLGNIVTVQQAREGEIQHSVGENDCGCFAFRTSALFQELESAARSEQACGTSTGEFNLLQVIPRFETHHGAIRTVRICDESETLGVNTRKDGIEAERVLGARRAA